MAELTLVKKLTKVMEKVKYIEKKGYNNFHKYKYATESDVAESVREVLAEQCVMMIPNVTNQSIREHTNAKGKTEYIATVNMEFTFYDGESGEKITFNTVGEGQDAGDKAVYKAMTGAQKYALMKAFMIPTGDDPERDEGVDERNNGGSFKKASDKQLGYIDSLLNQKVSEKFSKTDLYTHLKQQLNVTNDMENWSTDIAKKAISILQGK